MKKIVKIFLLSFIIFNLNNIVYAADQCYYMPGKNNTVVVPKGYHAECHYAFDKNNSNITGSQYSEIIAAIYNTNIELVAVTGNQSIKTDFLSLAIGDNRSSDQLHQTEFNWDGFVLSKKNDGSAELAGFQYDTNINGCPSFISWAVTARVSDRYIKFSGSSFSLNKNEYSKYATYKLIQDKGIDFIEDNPDPKTMHGDIYEYTASDDAEEFYQEELKYCSGNVDKIDQNLGGFEPSVQDKMEELKSCSYYLPIKNYDETCDLKVTLSYQKEISGGKTNFLVSSAVSRNNYDLTKFEGINVSLDNLNEKLYQFDYDNPATYSTIEDYLIYQNGNWVCPNKIYICNHANCKRVIFGEKDKDKYISMYGQDIYEGTTTPKNLCKDPTPTDVTNPSDGNSTIDWGNPVETNCEGILGQDLLDFINKIFRWIQILAPIFVIIMGGIDFAGAILQDDKDALKKASSKLVKRLIIAVALFFIPFILSFILNIFNDITGAGSSTCGIGG